MRVTIWHNISTDPQTRHVGMCDGYVKGHALVPVATYELPDEDLNQTTIDSILGDAWHVFNVGEDPTFGTPDPRALEYRRRKNRSLSVGDVVQLSTREDGEHPIAGRLSGDLWYACESRGWKQIGQPDWFAIGASCHDTTSLDTDRYNRN